MLRFSSIARVSLVTLSVVVGCLFGTLSAHADAPSPTHLVQRGETLWRIAHNAGIDVATLRQLNGLAEGDVLIAGRTLMLPAAPGNAANGASAIATYTVAPGETLWRIARQHGTSVDALLQNNGLERPEQLRAGTRLVIPSAPAPTVPTSQPEQPLGERLADVASRQEGRPYAWGGTDPNGFDCSGLVWYAAREAGIALPRDIQAQFGSGQKIERREDLRRGDVLFFENTYTPGLSHNGIYLGDGRFVHAVDEHVGVAVSRLDQAYWVTRFVGAARLS